MTRSVSRVVRLCSLLALAGLSATTLTAQQAIPGLDAAAMDRSVRPGDDFYQYANGTWQRETVIPADRSAVGAFSIAANRANAQLKDLVHGAAGANAPAGTDLRKIADYYTSYLDTAAIAARGLAPIRPALDSIAAIHDRTALARYMGSIMRADVDVINDGDLHTDNVLGLWVDQDFDDPARNSAALLQGGIAMPDRRYYIDSSTTMQETRRKYLAHVTRMLTLAKLPDPAGKAAAILRLETRIAGTHEDRADSWDVVKGNNHWTRAEFDTRAPGMDWDAFFGAAGLGRQPVFVAWQPGAITGISALVASQPLEDWKALLAYHAIEHRADVLPPAFDKERFAFFGEVLSGATEQSPRDERAIQAASAALGFAVGKLYVDRYFPASAKQQAESMVAGIIAAFNARIDALTWMAPATRAEAKRKLQTIKVSVGYPDQWPGYAGLDVARGDAFGNAARLERYQYLKNLEKLRGPVNRDEWSMTPQTVNAVNMPAMNALNFPAAILQPPFFDPDRTAAMNYAGMGAVIGHEISHSFDNLGANFDADGRLRNWWTPEDLAHFNAATQRLVEQYDAYRPFPDLAINGKLTVTENIADLAGLTAAYDAWRASLHGEDAPVVAGLTGDQQFFLSFAQVWRTKFREPALRQRLVTDGHAPGPYRARTVRNIDAWYPAFSVTPDDSLYLAPDARVKIW